LLNTPILWLCRENLIKRGQRTWWPRPRHSTFKV
jgi:hypothetical protein